MKLLQIRRSVVALAILLPLAAGLAQAQALTPQGSEIQAIVGTAFAYQGRLTSGGSPVTGTCSFQFSLWNAASGGGQVGTTQTKTGVTVDKGYFTVTLDFGADAFNGEARYLQIAVDCGSGYTTLSPRVTLNPAPYALALPGLRTQQNATSPNVIGGYSGNSVTSGAVGATVGGGGASGTANRVTDDYGAVGGGQQNRAGNDAGTTSDTPYATVGGGYNNSASGGYDTIGGGSNNTTSAALATIGGGSYNSAGGSLATVAGGSQNSASGENAFVGGGTANTAGGILATVGGGTENDAAGSRATIGGGTTNSAGGEYATVGGGASNTANYSSATVGGGMHNQANQDAATVGGGYYNTASGTRATVGGGSSNTAGTEYATVAGGYQNNASGTRATVAGGSRNTASGNDAAIGGGSDNTASGGHATVSGGSNNTAGGNFSFAAGQRAKATHAGSFVWADSTSADFNSTADNQFAVRANGGVLFSTSATVQINGNAVWHAGNDGSGLGLDADLLDGQHGSYYRSASNVNAGTLGTGYYSAYADLGAEGYLDNNAGADLLTRSQSDGRYWMLGGNPVSAVGVLGTSNNYALDVRVNNARALRLEPNATSPNVIGGYSENSVVGGALGVTIGGGGGYLEGNRVTDSYGTIGGGLSNMVGDNAGTTDDRRFATVGGGHANYASGYGATVGGGENNVASGYYAIIGGGAFNIASGAGAFVGGGGTDGAGEFPGNFAYAAASTIGGGYGNVIFEEAPYATIGGGNGNEAFARETFIGGGVGNSATVDRAAVVGGYYNTASANVAVVGGGANNTASGGYSVVPGGSGNTAAGQFSLAAGRQAKANNDGCFVWGDSTFADLVCSVANETIFRSSGGYYIYTSGDLTSGMYLAEGGSAWNEVSNRALKDNFAPVDGQALLERLAEIEISTWNYRSQDPAIRHIGPMADDFNGLVDGLGGEGMDHINSLDADGVALAAIQELARASQANAGDIAALEARVSELEQQNAGLAARLAALERRGQGDGSPLASTAGWGRLGLALAGLAVGAVLTRRGGGR